jgi:hypothetical protein
VGAASGHAVRSIPFCNLPPPTRLEPLGASRAGKSGGPDSPIL